MAKHESKKAGFKTGDQRATGEGKKTGFNDGDQRDTGEVNKAGINNSHQRTTGETKETGFKDSDQPRAWQPPQRERRRLRGQVFVTYRFTFFPEDEPVYESEQMATWFNGLDQ